MLKCLRPMLMLGLAWGSLQGRLDAAVIRGNVVEHQTGKALSRALVVVEPIAGTPGSWQRALTNRYGMFEFGSLPGGVYVVKISKPYFLPVEYGQKRWNSAGTPVVLDGAASTFLNIRLPRYGAIAGTVLDDSDVGLPDVDVVAYRNTRPPQVSERARTDERGMYRIYGLEPGAYVVRTVARLYEEGGYLPTYSPATASLEDARILDVDLDRQVANADVRPLPGKLLNLSGAFTSDLDPDIRITVTLISEMGRTTTQGGVFQFNSLAPGAYELFGQGFDPATGALLQAAYVPVQMVRDQRLVTPLQNLRDTQFDFQGAPPPAVSSGSVQVMARRKDLAGDGPAASLKLVNNRILLAPGRWEFSLAPPPGYFVAGFFGPFYARRPDARVDGWNETTIRGGFDRIRFVLSSGPAAVHGTVKDSSEPVLGAPVYLEGYDPDGRKRLTDLRVTRTDLHGLYRFEGLAPGNYRILATFEYLMP
ncbi:MAG TPA: carboxypeptidase-like regulatory domain-containing protein, partial [Candidatus Acidoferrales bacterium]|nr:carboxypeptidase-like regulatory domain-containing protein [Candidatus Acidoferrales bacterium]